MAWKVRVGDSWENTDDLTLDEIEAVEAASGVPWGFLNPLRSAPAAKALLAAFLVRRDGVSDEDARVQVGALKLKTVKNAFEYVEDDDLPDQWEGSLPVVDPKPAAVAPLTA